MENDKGRVAIVLEGSVPPDCAAVILYTTFPTHDAAVNAGRKLVEQQFAGCVNILPGMTSVYVWNGATEVAEEVVLLAKMPAAAFRLAAEAIAESHPYETPAILALPVLAASHAYLNWLRAGTRIDR